MYNILQKQNTKGFFLPGPTLGINAVDGLGEMAELDCLYAYNLVPTEYGMRLRKGYREWAIGITGTVRTIIPYDGTQEDHSLDRLFAVSEDGIWDVSQDGATSPTLVQAFSSSLRKAGQGVYTHAINSAGDAFLFYADEENGLFLYTESTGLWAQAADPTATGDTPPTADNIVFIGAHKDRIWFVGRNAADAWYFEPKAISGDATRFTLTGKLSHGGYLAGFWNWTIDGGNGIDDYLVFVSRAGDVVVYRGIDPEAIDGWSEVGTWFVGEIPDSRRIATEYGGEMYLLCAMGTISMHDLLKNNRNLRENAPSYRVSRLIRTFIDEFGSEPEWQLKHNPSDNSMIIVIPKLANDPDLQLVMDLTRKGWGYWRGIPMSCCDTWRGMFFMGDDGRVLLSDGTVDDAQIGGPTGENIEYSILSSYQVLQEPALYKRVQYIRAKGAITGGVTVNVNPIYDFDVSPDLASPGPVQVDPGSAWDAGIWDTAVWGGVAGNAHTLRGGRNMGLHVAIAMRGEATERFTFVGWDIMWDTGGFL